MFVRPPQLLKELSSPCWGEIRPVGLSKRSETTASHLDSAVREQFGVSCYVLPPEVSKEVPVIKIQK